MRLLLDSHVAYWWLDQDRFIGPDCRSAISGADEVFVSVVTPWELGIKRSKGQLSYPDGLVAGFQEAGFAMLTVASEHAEKAPELPMHHRDPFDRMLIAQAQTESLTLVTADEVISQYRVDVLNAKV